MRTTVTLDPAIAKKITSLAQKKRSSFRAELDYLLRRGLAYDGASEPRAPFVVTPHPSRFVAGVDLGKLNQLADDLDTDDFARKATATR